MTTTTNLGNLCLLLSDSLPLDLYIDWAYGPFQTGICIVNCKTLMISIRGLNDTSPAIVLS